MFYKKELEFFIKAMGNLKINSNIIDECHLTEDIDMGIRRLLNLENDYTAFFSQCFGKSRNEVVFVTDMFLCTYVFMPLPENENNSILVLGPYTKSLITKNTINKRTVESSLPAYINEQLEKFYSAIPYIQNDDIILSLVNSMCEIAFKSIENFSVVNLIWQRDSDIVYTPKNSEHTKEADPWLTIQFLERRYAIENELINAVSKGLTHKAEMIFSNIKPENALESRLTDNLRNTKNYMIILNTLLRKAAEQGKVHPYHIDLVSSDLALKIEAMQASSECEDLLKYMVKKYCRLVNKHSQKSYSLLIQKVTTQIESDLSSDLSLNNLASIFGVNSSYLSSLFKKETGVTLTEYVNKKRVERAKELLLSTNLQIQNISQRCGILDVNYFTKTFKKHTGLTPKKYREKHA